MNERFPAGRYRVRSEFLLIIIMIYYLTCKLGSTFCLSLSQHFSSSVFVYADLVQNSNECPLQPGGDEIVCVLIVSVLSR